MKTLAIVLALLVPSVVAAEPPIAFWLANTHYGKTRAAAMEACEHSMGHQSVCRTELVKVRGPYHRKTRSSDPEDDPKVYVYKGSNGEWYDVRGFPIGCDPSGCP